MDCTEEDCPLPNGEGEIKNDYPLANGEVTNLENLEVDCALTNGENSNLGNLEDENLPSKIKDQD